MEDGADEPCHTWHRSQPWQLQRVRHVVAVEVEGGDDVVLLRTEQDLLQERVGYAVLDDDLVAIIRVLDLHPGSLVDELAADIYGPKITMPQGLGTGMLFTDNIPMPLEIRNDCLWITKRS